MGHFLRHLIQIYIDIIANFSFKHGNVKFYPNKKLRFLSEYVS